MEEPDLAEAVAALERLKAEHRDLLLTIAGDPGMEPDTRKALVEHVLEEEDEKIARIAWLAANAPSAAPGTRMTGGRGQLTVGSLRSQPLPGRDGRRLGSLRQDH